jgi:hypothetical protein
MKPGLARFFGALLGGLVVLASAIAYDTSAEVGALEGGHAHLRIAVIGIAAGFGAFVGFIVAAGLSFED